MASGVPANPAATRARILNTATSLFYERGVHAVGVNEIAARAGASKLSLYRYFPSKDQLVQAMLTEHSDRIHAWLERETAGRPRRAATGARGVRPADRLVRRARLLRLRRRQRRHRHSDRS